MLWWRRIETSITFLSSSSSSSRSSTLALPLTTTATTTIISIYPYLDVDGYVGIGGEDLLDLLRLGTYLGHGPSGSMH